MVVSVNENGYRREFNFPRVRFNPSGRICFYDREAEVIDLEKLKMKLQSPILNRLTGQDVIELIMELETAAETLNHIEERIDKIDYTDQHEFPKAIGTLKAYLERYRNETKT